MTRRREQPVIRKEEILSAALRLAERIGYYALTRERIAAESDFSCSLITWYFRTMTQLRQEVIQTAIDRKILGIVAQALSVGDLTIDSLTPDMRKDIKTFFD